MLEVSRLHKLQDIEDKKYARLYEDRTLRTQNVQDYMKTGHQGHKNVQAYMRAGH